MNAAARFFLQGFVLFAPWAAWLALTGWLRLPTQFLLVGILFAAPFLVKAFGRKPSGFFRAKEDLLLLGIAALAWISFGQGTGSSKSFNHSLAFSFVFIMYGLYFKYAWHQYKMGLAELLRLCFWAVVLVDVLIAIEWTCFNIFSLLIRPWFLLVDEVSNMYFYFQYFYYSVPGVCEEPSLMAFNLNCLFPLGLYWVDQQGNRLLRLFYIVLHVFAMIFLASSGGLAFLILAFGLSRLAQMSWASVGRLVRVIGSGMAIMGLVYLSLPLANQNRVDQLVGTIIDKVTFEGSSAKIRLYTWKWAIRDWLEYPVFGVGPGYGNEQYAMWGYQSAYFKILAETGTLSFLLWVLYLVLVGMRVFRTREPFRQYLMVAFLAAVMHFAIADCYYHVSFWIVAAVAQLIYWQRNEAAKVSLPSSAETVS